MPHPQLHVALVPVGSHGDVHPFVGIGVRLLARGHRVTVLTNAHFEPLVRRSKLDFLPLGSADDYKRVAADPDLWHTRKGFQVVARNVTGLVRPMYDAVAKLHADDGDRLVVAASSLGFGARVAQDKLGVRLASVHLSPAVFQSAYAMPRYPGMPSPVRWPRWFKRLLYVPINRMVDGALAGPLNAIRADLRLPPVRGIMRAWWHSPQLVLATFPEWFAAVQPDWPPQTRAIGFPLYDERGTTPMPAALDRFLADGPPPVAFTPGSAMARGRSFFAASAEACRRLGRRGVLLTRFADQVPADLPPGVVHADYAPFSELLPRCAAVVHHGGIGSAAQALAAGCPQLVQPFAHDQVDNADRLVRLGVARAILPKQYEPANVARELAALLASEAVVRRCREVASRMRTADAIGEACDLIEGLAACQRPGPGPLSPVLGGEG